LSTLRLSLTFTYKYLLTFSFQGTKQILHVTSNQCLDCDPHTKELFMNPCDQSVDTQKWTIEHVDVEKVQNEWHNTN
jgi:hypothetical protein